MHKYFGECGAKGMACFAQGPAVASIYASPEALQRRQSKVIVEGGPESTQAKTGVVAEDGGEA